MAPSDRRPTGEYSDDSITAYRIQQLEAKQDIANGQNEKILGLLNGMSTQMALGNTRMDASDKRLDAIETDKRAVTGLYTAILALLGAIASGAAAVFSKHAPIIVAALLLCSCQVRDVSQLTPAERVIQHREEVLHTFDYIYGLAVLLGALAAFLAFEGSIKIAIAIAVAAGALVASALLLTFVIANAGWFLAAGFLAGVGGLIYHYRAKISFLNGKIP